MTNAPRLRTTSRPALALGPLAGLALLIAGCGGAYGGSAPASSAGTQGGSAPASASGAQGAGGGYGYAPSTTAAAATASVNQTSSKLGTLLTDGQGRTLYLFEKDQAGASACTAACMAVWPPLTTTGSTQAGPGVAMSMLSTIHRPDGAIEVTYNGHPLYLYAGDGKPGDTNGQGLKQFGAGWYVVSPNGAKIDNG